MRRLIFALLILVPSLLLVAQDADLLTPMDVAMLQSVTSVQLSEDGSLLAFTRSVPADPTQENKPAGTHLFIHNVATGQTVPFYTRGSVRDVAFRPGAAGITFLAKLEGDKTTALYEMPLTGGEASRIFSFETSISSYEWSADGQHLAFIAAEPEKEEKDKLPYQPIVYEENLTYARAYLVDMASDKLMPERLQLEGDVNSLAWNPNGKMLAVMAAPTPLVDDFYMAQEIHWVDAKTKKATGLVQLLGKKGDFAFSPDGSKLAIIAGATINDPIDGRLFVVGTGEAKPKNIKPDFPGAFDHFEWIDDNTLQFLASEGVEASLGTIKVADGAIRRSMDKKMPNFTRFDRAGNGTLALVGDTPQHPAEAYLIKPGEGMLPMRVTNSNPWLDEEKMGAQEVVSYQARDGAVKRTMDKKMPNFTRFDRAGNGTLALVGDTPQHPSEAYLVKPGEGMLPMRVTNSNPWLDQEKMGEQEVISYQARDGLRIEGLLIKPVDYEEGKKYPLITVVHGGPEAHYDHGWLTSYSTPGQMAAGQGYAVFYPNYRGSTGRGVAFAMSSQGDLAGKEFDDIVDGVDYLIEQGLVDKDKVGVTGGSYGGYATGWMATRYTDRFAAGVMFVGISDNISKWGTSDIPEELYLVHARKRIWEDYEWFLKRSPIYYAGQARTPLLIMAGAEDTRVDPSQSMELYRHIKTRTDTPVRLVLYPGEGHGNRNATARYDYSLRMLGWFNKYLKNEEARP